MYIANAMLLGLNLPLIRVWVRMLSVPYHYIATIVVIICIVGAYSIKNSASDVGMMILFAVLGYFLRKGGFPAAPMVLAMILGRILELSVQQAFKISGANPMIFIYKPISAGLLCVAILFLMLPLFKWAWTALLARRK
jgi:putative tricarboxylic transport membrane protein